MTRTATTTTATTATTQSYYSALNKICNQKCKMSKEEKAQVSDFIIQHVNGEVKVEFSKSVPADAEYIKIRQGDKVIVLAYSSNTANTIYVMVAANTSDTEEVVTVQPKKKLDNDDLYKVIMGTIKHVKDMIAEKRGISIGMNGETALYNFLVTQEIKGRIIPLTCAEFPEDISVQEVRYFDGYAMELALTENSVNKERYPHVLWVRIKMTEWAEKREFLKSRKSRFSKLWANNNLPGEILEEVLKKIDLTKNYKIVSYKIVKKWVTSRKEKNGELVYIGQTPDPKTGGFVPNRPIGYIIDDMIVITNPKAAVEFKVVEFK